MKDALTPTCAVSGAHRAGRATRVVRAAVVGLVLVAAASAHAQQDGYGQDRRDDPRLVQPDPRLAQPDPRFQRPPEPQRDARIDPRIYDSRELHERRQQMQQEQQGSRRAGRLTPDERRDLRRQINEAGQDLYPPRRR